MKLNKLKHQSLEHKKIYCNTEQGEFVAHTLQNPELPESFQQSFFFKAEWGQSIPMCVISSFTILWLMVINLEVSKVWGLLTHDQVVIKFLPFVAIFYYVKNSRNIHEILLPGYFREELTQRIWGRGVAQEVPTRSFTKRFSMITQIWGELRQTELNEFYIWRTSQTITYSNVNWQHF